MRGLSRPMDELSGYWRCLVSVASDPSSFETPAKAGVRQDEGRCRAPLSST